MNGRRVAALWCKPYACDLTEHLTKDRNEITVKVTSTWYNRLVHDAALPEAERGTWTLRGPRPGAPYRPAGLLSRAVLRAE